MLFCLGDKSLLVTYELIKVSGTGYDKKEIVDEFNRLYRFDLSKDGIVVAIDPSFEVNGMSELFYLGNYEFGLLHGIITNNLRRIERSSIDL